MASGSNGDQQAALRLHGDEARGRCFALAPVGATLAFIGGGFCRDGGGDDLVDLDPGHGPADNQGAGQGAHDMLSRSQ